MTSLLQRLPFVSTAPIQVFVPTENIAARLSPLIAEMNLTGMVACHISFLHDALLQAREMDETADVFVTRRGTTSLFRRYLQTPVIDIPVTLQDMSEALKRAKSICKIVRPSIAFFGMTDSLDELKLFASLLNFDLRIYPILENIHEQSMLVDEAIAEGVHVFIGGTTIAKMGRTRNIPTLMLDTSTISLRMALQEAGLIARARIQAKRQFEQLNNIVTNITGGVVFYDGTRHLIMANPAAEKMLGRTHVRTGTPILSDIPAQAINACYSGEEIKNLVVNVGNNTFLLSMVPNRVGNAIHGIIVFLIPAESVTDFAVAIHKEQHARGFVSRYTFDNIIGISPCIRQAKQKAARIARNDCPVLLLGETGTGKELFAHAIHHASPRSVGAFISVNCAALPSELLESELFGYEEGAFTGATRKGKAGMFELAHNGTIFLDEISELDRHAQIRLLRVLQEQCLMRLGGNRIIPINVRIISATNRNLWEMVTAGMFRKDLFYRLNVLSLLIPPLRNRIEDVRCILEQTLDSTTLRKLTTSGALWDRLLRHSWPGNIRELLNVIERIRYCDHAADLDDILEPERAWGAMEGCIGTDAHIPTDQDDERDRIVRALAEERGHRGRAASALGMNRSTLYRKCLQYGIGKGGHRASTSE